MSKRPKANAFRKWIRWETLAVFAVMVWSFVLKLHNLGHTSLTEWDESVHATVARNLLRHPFKPTLFDEVYLTDHWQDWAHSHIWLHKPILPLWQIAFSFWALGFNNFALRFPSVVLSTLAVGLLYLIGTELFDRKAGLFAAGILAFSPALMMLVQGYLFADHIDISLLFWTEVAIYLLVLVMRTGRWWLVTLSGIAQGLAFLSKSFPALIVTGLVLTVYLAPLLRLSRQGQSRLRWWHLLVFVGAAVLTAGPWLLNCYIQWPREFVYENLGYLKHLNSDYEGWGLPWYRLAYDYMLFLYDGFYTPALVALLVAIPTALLRRDLRLGIVVAWALGVLVPHLISQTKTPTMTLLAVPAMVLLIGQMMSGALARDRIWWPFAMGIFLMCLIMPPHVPDWYGFCPQPGFMANYPDWPAARWVVWHLIATAAIAFLLICVLRFRDLKYVKR